MDDLTSLSCKLCALKALLFKKMHLIVQRELICLPVEVDDFSKNFKD